MGGIIADYTTKAGESLANMQVGFIGRDGLPVDLTGATITVNVRQYSATTNTITDGACGIVAPATEGVVRGPPQTLPAPGGYSAVFKVAGLVNGPHEFPSDGIFRIQVQDDLS